MANVFISYLRADSAGWTKSLANDLKKKFGSNHIFMDIDSLAAGIDYINEIDKSLISCNIALVIIGPQWISVLDEKNRRRLDESEDHVRIEIQTSLERNIPVIPVAVGGAKMPSAEDFSATLRPLKRRNAFDISD